MNQGLFFLMLIAALAFSLNPIIAKSIVNEVSYSGYILMRFLFVALFLPMIAVVMSEISFKSFFEIKLKGYLEFFVLSIFFAGNMLLYYYAFNYIDINRAQFIFFTYPVFTVILARFVLKEKATIEEMTAVFLTLVGAVIIFWGSGFSGSTVIGDIMVLASAVMWAAYVVFNRYTALREVHYRQTFWVFLFSSVLILPFYTLFDFSNPLTMSATAIYALLAFGFIGNLLPYTIMNFASKHLRSTVIGLFILLSMILTVFLSVILLGESITTQTIMGGTLIIFGSMISIMSFKSVFLLNRHIKSRLKENRFLSIVKRIFKKEEIVGEE